MIKRVLEASDFLNGQFTDLLLPPSAFVRLRTLGDCADVEIHDLSPREGLRVFELYFHRHSLATRRCGYVWQKPWNQTKLVTTPIPSLSPLPRRHSGDGDRVYLRPSHIPDVSVPISLTMSPTLPGFLFDIPRNPAVAVGLPLTLGFLSGSGTKKVINGIWYQVTTHTRFGIT